MSHLAYADRFLFKLSKITPYQQLLHCKEFHIWFSEVGSAGGFEGAKGGHASSQADRHALRAPHWRKESVPVEPELRVRLVRHRGAGVFPAGLALQPQLQCEELPAHLDLFRNLMDARRADSDENREHRAHCLDYDNRSISVPLGFWC